MKQITVLDLEYNQLSGTIPDDFLSGSTVKDQRIRVALNHNYLAGSVPSSLIAFDNLSLEVVGNQIEAIPDALCDPANHGKWMDGMVGQVGTCAAIACPRTHITRTADSLTLPFLAHLVQMLPMLSSGTILV